jgi:hypothetical protein
VGEVSQVDYINNLTMLAVVGEFGFGKVVGIGEYLLDPVLQPGRGGLFCQRPLAGQRESANG